MAKTVGTMETAAPTAADDYAAAQARLDAAERRYAEMEVAMTGLEAIAASGTDPAVRVRARRELPGVRESRDDAFVEREDAKAALVAVAARHTAGVRALHRQPKRDAALDVHIAMGELWRAMAILLEAENAEADALGERRPIEMGTSLTLAGWAASALPQESVPDFWSRAAKREGLLVD